MRVYKFVLSSWIRTKYLFKFQLLFLACLVPQVKQMDYGLSLYRVVFFHVCRCNFLVSFHFINEQLCFLEKNNEIYFWRNSTKNKLFPCIRKFIIFSRLYRCLQSLSIPSLCASLMLYIFSQNYTGKVRAGIDSNGFGKRYLNVLIVLLSKGINR